MGKSQIHEFVHFLKGTSFYVKLFSLESIHCMKTFMVNKKTALPVTDATHFLPSIN